MLINSGNIRNPRARRSEWILDETVWVVGDLAEGLVRTDPAYAAYRADLDDAERMKAHAAYRDRVFLLPRPLDFYLETLELGGPEGRVRARGEHQAGVQDWYEFLADVQRRRARLGRRHREGRRRRAPSEQAVADRLALMRHAMDVLFHGRPDVPGMLDLHHLCQRSLERGRRRYVGAVDEHGECHEAQHRPHPHDPRGQPGPAAPSSSTR